MTAFHISAQALVHPKICKDESPYTNKHLWTFNVQIRRLLKNKNLFKNNSDVHGQLGF